MTSCSRTRRRAEWQSRVTRRVLVDTGAWLAALVRRDRYHVPGAEQLRRLRRERARLVVTDLILAELHVNLVRARGGAEAARYLWTIKSDPAVEEVFADADLQAGAMHDWIERFPDQAFTLTDAISFAAMRAQRIPAAFTFDRHFQVAGFQTLP